MENHPTTLADWLARLETMHPKAIDMGLDRVRQVKDAMALEFACPVIIVGGTNGKGSTCAMLEAILLRAGYRVGLYTSPHLLHFNERMRINGQSASDAELVAAFDKLDALRAEVSLSYF
jgi:dihydrofolate synthase/folylpolyglutamate synthase